jgi:hypothetical protein
VLVNVGVRLAAVEFAAPVGPPPQATKKNETARTARKTINCSPAVLLARIALHVPSAPVAADYTLTTMM